MFRADAVATLYFFHPLQRLLGRTGGLPILMYHSVSDREETSHPYYRTVTSPEVFRQQMRYLHENGYSTISVGEAVRELEKPDRTGRRSVAITFDDGFRDFYTKAFPILTEYGFTATMYLPTAFIGNSPQPFKGTDCMSWSEVRELAEAGVEFGSHTVTHPQLRTLPEADVHREVKDSKATIEQQLGRAVDSFAYPYAFPETDTVFTAMLRRSLIDSGYENGVGTIIGTATSTGDKLFLRRLPVNSCDGARLFQAKLEGGYDWLHTAQVASKNLKMKSRTRMNPVAEPAGGRS